MTHFKDAYIWEIINKCFEGKTKNIVIKYYVKLCHHLLHQRDIPIKTKKNLNKIIREKIRERHHFTLPEVIIE